MSNHIDQSPTYSFDDEAYYFHNDPLGGLAAGFGIGILAGALIVTITASIMLIIGG